jgi:AcrR family transcriptional regulator
MADEKRVYRKKRRAELEAKTRLRITESAMALHGTLGPARTSMSAVAQHAGVRRSTVYRHFPDETALFAACTAHWMAQHPPPELTRWAAVADPDDRLAAALGELYDYYAATERMMENVHRDEATVPIVKRMLAQFRDYLSAARDTLAAGRKARGKTRQQLDAAIGHALAFPTWHSLTREQGLDNAQAADLMGRLVKAAARRPGTTT